ncbi:MAG: glycosyltransferase [Crocinitomicaceae bacterium]|nr:glycosyltransferase [Crocinitomicaceae bacterium]
MGQRENEVLISVVIPIHNRSEELSRAITSVLKQTEQSFEVLILDDASTEDLNLVITSFNDSRIKLIRNDVKTNSAVMRNIGIRNASGQFIAFLDSDDEWFPDHLSSKIALLLKENADGVYGSSFICDGENSIYTPILPMRLGQHPADYILSGGAIPTPTWFVKRSCASEIMFDESLTRHQDYDFFIRFTQKFKWEASRHPSVIVNWIKGTPRIRDFKSGVIFIQRYFKYISPKAYFRYHFTYLKYLEQSDKKELEDYYKKECLRYIHHISFLDYCSISGNKRSILINWIMFSFLLLWRKFKKMPPPVLPS